mmetsp:Transcript_50653/g.93650  ORF Transcript_50653/g.93650 Transcript_50653/m.93650 type:complete len:135 (+) Transcript_50653:820-1224(+)
MKLDIQYKFSCACSVCSDPNLEAAKVLDRMIELDDAIMDLGSTGNVSQATRKGKALLALYGKYGITSWSYYRTYYDLIQVAITKRRTFKEGVNFLKKSYQAVLDFTGDEKDPIVEAKKSLMLSPQSHRNYLILE